MQAQRESRAPQKSKQGEINTWEKETGEKVQSWHWHLKTLKWSACKYADFISTWKLFGTVCQKGFQQMKVFLKSHVSTLIKGTQVCALSKQGWVSNSRHKHRDTQAHTQGHTRAHWHTRTHMCKYLNSKFFFGNYRVIIYQISSFLDTFYSKARWRTLEVREG